MNRQGLSGPVVASLAAKDTPGIAAHDARWSARVLAGWVVSGYEGGDPAAVDAVRRAVLRDLLAMCGLTDDQIMPWQRGAAS